jgi:hypothetical protein
MGSNNKWYETGDVSGYNTYAGNIQAIKDAVTRGELTEEEGKSQIKAVAEDTLTPSQDLSQFETLLGKLEGSKMRQQRQKSVEGRRDMFNQGLAQMMSNF